MTGEFITAVITGGHLGPPLQFDRTHVWDAVLSNT
jgi:hypothetical protein